VRTHYFKYFKELLFLGALLFLLITTSCTESKENNITTIIAFDEYKISSINEGDSFYIDEIKVFHSKNIDTIVSTTEIVLPSYNYNVIIDGNNIRKGLIKTNKVELAKFLSKGLINNGYQITNQKAIDIEGKIYIESNNKLNIKKTDDFPLIYNEK
tara:strand:+ start:827 stop:1294 length:468 start_codon:yes stop_codon:yes gene_type:complete